MPQATVAREYQALFCARRPNQAVAAQVLSIDYILADDAQPLDQPAEHAVGGEFPLACRQLNSQLD
jgi:hypothetical protein